MTDVTAALEENTSNLALLYIGQAELQEPVASIDIVLYQVNTSCRVTCTERDPNPRLKQNRTSLVMMTLKMPFRTSVFMPCARASLASSLSPCASLVWNWRACPLDSVSSARGSPAHAAPTSHHLPRVVDDRISSSVTRKGSGAAPVETNEKGVGDRPAFSEPRAQGGRARGGRDDLPDALRLFRPTRYLRGPV